MTTHTTTPTLFEAVSYPANKPEQEGYYTVFQNGFTPPNRNLYYSNGVWSDKYHEQTGVYSFLRPVNPADLGVPSLKQMKKMLFDYAYELGHCEGEGRILHTKMCAEDILKTFRICSYAKQAELEAVRKENETLRRRCSLNYGGGFTEEEITINALRHKLSDAEKKNRENAIGFELWVEEYRHKLNNDDNLDYIGTWEQELLRQYDLYLQSQQSNTKGE